MSKLSAEQVSQIAELRERGWSYDRLAAKFNVSPGAIHYRCLCEGARSPRAVGIRYPRSGQRRFGFGGEVRPFTPAEDARLLQLARSGLKVAAISEAIGRPRTSVRIRIMTLELAEAAE